MYTKAPNACRNPWISEEGIGYSEAGFTRMIVSQSSGLGLKCRSSERTVSGLTTKLTRNRIKVLRKEHATKRLII